MESSKVAELAKRHAPVVWQERKYTLAGYQVYYKGKEVLKSALLLDDMKRLYTVPIKDIEQLEV